MDCLSSGGHSGRRAHCTNVEVAGVSYLVSGALVGGLSDSCSLFAYGTEMIYNSMLVCVPVAFEFILILSAAPTIGAVAFRRNVLSRVLLSFL